MSVESSNAALHEVELRKAKAVADFFEFVKIPAFIALCLLTGALPFLIWSAL